MKLWIGQAISQMGSGISSTALPLLAISVLRASPFQMGLLSGASAAAILVFGLIAGAWADRVRRRPILILADLGRAAVFGSIPLAAAWHRLTMGHLYLAAACAGLLSVFFEASYQAYVPSLVDREKIVEANSQLALTESIAGIGAPGIGGFLVQTMGAPLAVLCDAGSFVFSALSVWRIAAREPEPQPPPERHILREIAEGLRVTRDHPMLSALAKRAASSAFFMGFMSSLYFVFAVRDLHLSAALVGTVVSIGGISNLFGAFASQRLVTRFGFGRVLIGSAFLCAGSIGLPALASGPPLVAAAFLAAGQAFDLGFSVYHINELSLRQTVTPERLLGRVNAAMRILFFGMIPAGAVVGGAIAQAIGMRTTMAIGGAGVVLSTLWLVRSPIRRLRKITDAVPLEIR